MKRDSFPFVLAELEPIRPTVKRAFGMTYVYLDEKLLCCLRDSEKLPATNGLWLFTTTEHVDSLAREFPDLPRRCLWRSGRNAWVIIASRLEYFEEYAIKACELMLNGDRRIGRISRAQRVSPVERPINYGQRLLRERCEGKEIVWLRSRAEVEKFFARLRRQ